MPAPTSLLKGFARDIATAKPDPKKRLHLFDTETRGLCLRITPKGSRTFTIVARDPAGKQVWAAVPGGDPEYMALEDAREAAREGVRRIKAGLEPFPAPEPSAAPETFGDVVANFIARHVKALRSAGEVERIFNVIVLPEWKDRPFRSIRRGDVAKLLDDVEDNRGPVMADRTLATLSKLFNWYAAREDDYSSPIVKGMARTKPRERARKRILTDAEIRLLWPVLEGQFGALVKVALLTGQRRAKVAGMRWQDIADDGTWTIPAEKREKSNAGELLLPDYTLVVIREQKSVAGNPHVFAGRGKAHIAGFSALKRDLDAKAAEANEGTALEGWTLHDLRRTAKSLMARAGVRPDISERVLGHVIGGVEGTYDRHDYRAEKAEALSRLAGLVNTILNPPGENVVPMRAGAAQ